MMGFFMGSNSGPKLKCKAPYMHNGSAFVQNSFERKTDFSQLEKWLEYRKQSASN